MNRQFVRFFLKGSAFASFGTLATIVFHFLSIMVMTRNMPKDEFGIYVLILALVHGVKILAGLGLDLTLAKFASDDEESALMPIIVVRAVTVTVISILLYSAGHLILPLMDERISLYLLYIPIMAALASYRELLFHYLQGLRQFKSYAFVQVFSAVLKFGSIVALLSLIGLDIRRLIYVEIGTFSLSLCVQLFLIIFKGNIDFNLSPETFRRVIKFGFPLYLNNILTFVHGRTGVFLIAFFLNPVSVAFYEVAKKIPEAFSRLFQSFITVYFPNSSKLFSEGRKEGATELMNKSLVLLSVAIVSTALMTFLFRDEIIVLIFSAKYLPSSLALSLLMINFYLRAISNLLGYSLVSAGNATISAKVNTVASAVSTIGSLLMIPAYGFMGVVYARIAMNLITQLLYYSSLARAGINPNFKEYLKPFGIFVMMVGAYLLFGSEALFTRLLILVVFLVLCWASVKELRKAACFAFANVHKLRWQTRSS